MIEKAALTALQGTLTAILAAITAQTAELQQPTVVSIIPVSVTATGTPQELVADNPDRLKMMVAHVSGLGTALIATKQEALATIGFPVRPDGPTFVDGWPHVHKGKWFVQVDVAPTTVAVIQWTRVPA